MKTVKLFFFILHCALLGLLPIVAIGQTAPQICSSNITEHPAKTSTDTPKTLGTATSIITVSGFTGKIADVDLKTVLKHTTSNVVMTLQSPAGTTVTLTSNNGWGIENAFDGTVWNDSADPGDTGDGLVTDCSYSVGNPKTSLAPEEPLGSFFGENPNGQWKLSISSASGSGRLAAWDLRISTVPTMPVTVATNYENGESIPVSGFQNEFLSDIGVDGLSGKVVKVQVKTNLQYNHNSYVSMFLVAPSGRVVTLSSKNGGANADVFDGTLWTDRQNAGYATDFNYTNFATATPLAPEEGFASLLGEDPNGIWTLKVKHTPDGSSGTLNGWELFLETCDYGVPAVATVLKVKQFNTQNTPEFGVANIQFEGMVSNTGTQNISLTQLLSPLADEFGTGFLGIAEMPQITGGNAAVPPAINPQFDGIFQQNLILPNTGTLNPGESFKFTFRVLIDPDAFGAIEQPSVQIFCDATGMASGFNTQDASDSGDNPQGTNPGAPGDLGNADDPTPVFAPILKSSMRLLSACGNDTCGVAGHTDAIFEVKLKNIGNTALDQISLENKMKTEMGTLFFAANPTQNVIAAGTNAAQKPGFNPTFNGIDQTKIFLGTNGKLLPGQTIVLHVYAELNNVQAATLPAIFNRAESRARAIDQNGDPLLAPETANIWHIADWTDNGADPASTNPASPGQMSGEDDKTPVPFIALIADASDLTLELGQDVAQNWLETGGQAQLWANGCPNIMVEHNYSDSLAWTPGNCGATGKRTVTFTFKGDCSNVCLQTTADVIFEDHAAPVFTILPSDLTITCGNETAIEAWLAAPSAADPDGVTISNNFSAPAAIGEALPVVFTATDACGNAQTATAFLTIIDQSAPTFVNFGQPTKTIACGETPEFDTPLAIDNCSEVSLIFVDQSVTDGCEKTYSRTWIAADATGNTTVIVQTIIETDEVAPVFAALPADLNMTGAEWQNWLQAQGWQAIIPLATDNCSSAATMYLGFAPEDSCHFILNWVAADACGNLASVTNRVSITDCGVSATGEIATGSDMQIFPNPASQVLHIRFANENSAQSTRYRISDSAGRIVMMFEKPADNQENIDVSALATGTYFLVAESEDKVFRAAFVKTTNE